MNGLLSVLGRSLRGLRLVEAFALVMLVMMILGNYLAKARAGRERGEITAVETQISEEGRRLRLLQAEVAHLEQPERLEQLASAAGLGPTNAKREGAIDQLPEIARSAMVSDKGQRQMVAGNPQSGFEAAPAKPVVMAAAGRTGAPQ